MFYDKCDNSLTGAVLWQFGNMFTHFSRELSKRGIVCSCTRTSCTRTEQVAQKNADND